MTPLPSLPRREQELLGTEPGTRPRAQLQPARRRQAEIKRNSGLPEPGKSEMSLGGERPASPFIF